MLSQATALQWIYAPFKYESTMPNEAKVGPKDIIDPLSSGRATSVM